MSKPAEPPASIPATPPRAPSGLRALFKLRASPRRWPAATRAAICFGVPVMIGWLAGDQAAGLLASLGAFTVLYGADRPYLNRALTLACVGVTMSVSVGLGVWASSAPWVGLVTVAAIATLATWFTNALNFPPPGAYMFALVSAVAVDLPEPTPAPGTAMLLALATAAFSWIVEMSGALLDPRGPEKAAVKRVARAVAAYADAIGGAGQDAARHNTALALHEAWDVLITRQPSRVPFGRRLRRLRVDAQRLHMMFADAMTAAATRTKPDPSLAEQARSIAESPGAATGVDDPGSALPIGRPAPSELIHEYVRPGSWTLLVVQRVAVATLVAGGIGLALGLDHAFWALSTAVIAIYQGLDRTRTIQRGLERVAGTLVGLGLAGVIISLHPQGLWLVAAMMVLNFLIEVWIIRSYAIAAVFMTSAALVVASGSQASFAVGDLLLARLIDTALGCGVAVAVFLVMVPRTVSTWLPTAIADTLDAVAGTVDYLDRSAVGSTAGRAARRDLQRSVFRLAQTFDVDINGSAAQRTSAESSWPAVATTQSLAYRVLATCWHLLREPPSTAGALPTTAEGADQSPDAPPAGGIREPTRAERGEWRLAAASLAADVRQRRKPGPIGDVPALLARELNAVGEALRREPT